MISRDPEAALYRKIAADIREKIANGTLRPGQILGSITSLAYTYDVGLGTVRRVLAVLRAERLITVAHGQITRVREAVLVELVEVEPGSTMTFRVPTAAEAQRWDIPAAVTIAEVTADGEVRPYATDRTVFTFRLPAG